jgi:hypothetical protein
VVLHVYDLDASLDIAHGLALRSGTPDRWRLGPGPWLVKAQSARRAISTRRRALLEPLTLLEKLAAPIPQPRIDQASTTAYWPSMAGPEAIRAIVVALVVSKTTPRAPCPSP